MKKSCRQLSSFWHNTGAWRTDGRTDTLRSLLPALAQRRAGKKSAFLTFFCEIVCFYRHHTEPIEFVSPYPRTFYVLQVLHRVRKKTALKHVKITLWMITIIFLCIMYSHLFAMFVWNFMTTSLSITEILLLQKDGQKLSSPTLQINACITLYAQPIMTSALSVYVIFA